MHEPLTPRTWSPTPDGPASNGDGRHPLVAEIEQLRAELDEVRHKAANLEIALHSGREIGAAIGIIMITHRVTYDQGFEILRELSQHTHRKLRDLAAEVVLTGALPDREPIVHPGARERLLPEGEES